MEICKAPTLRLKALNKHTHIMYIEMENVIQNNKYVYIDKCSSIIMQNLVGAQTVVSLLQTTQIISDVCFITDHVAYASSNKTTIVWIETELFFSFFFFTRGGCASRLRACLGARLLPRSYQYRNLSEGADRIGGQLRGDKECPFSGVTKSGRVWRKVPESHARSVAHWLTRLWEQVARLSWSVN